MGGVYVAKPDIEIELDVPPGWDPGWTFPGPPFPPGYDPLYSFTLDTPSGMVPGNPVTGNTLTLYDNVTYATSNPPETIIYSATKKSDGTIVQLKFSGGPTFLNSVSGAYSDLGDFFGAQPEFEFNVTDADIGDTIVLRASSSPFGFSITNTSEILIVIPVVTATLEVTYNPDLSGPFEIYYHKTTVAAENGVSVTEIGFATSAYQYNFPGDKWFHATNYDGDVVVTHPYAGNGTAWFAITFTDSIYQIRIDSDQRPGDATASYELKIYIGGVLSGTYTKVQSYTVPWSPPGDLGEIYIWGTIDGSDGTFTLVDDLGPGPPDFTDYE